MFYQRWLSLVHYFALIAILLCVSLSQHRYKLNNKLNCFTFKYVRTIEVTVRPYNYNIIWRQSRALFEYIFN